MSHSVYKNPPRRSPGHRYYRYRNLQFATFVLILIKLIWILSIRRTAGLADRRMTAPQWTCQRGVLTPTFAALPPFSDKSGLHHIYVFIPALFGSLFLHIETGSYSELGRRFVL